MGRSQRVPAIARQRRSLVATHAENSKISSCWCVGTPPHEWSRCHQWRWAPDFGRPHRVVLPAWEAPYQQQDDGRSSSCRLMLPTQGERFDGSDQATTKIVAQTRRLSLIKPMAFGEPGRGLVTQRAVRPPGIHSEKIAPVPDLPHDGSRSRAGVGNRPQVSKRAASPFWLPMWRIRCVGCPQQPAPVPGFPAVSPAR